MRRNSGMRTVFALFPLVILLVIGYLFGGTQDTQEHTEIPEDLCFELWIGEFGPGCDDGVDPAAPAYMQVCDDVPFEAPTYGFFDEDKLSPGYFGRSEVPEGLEPNGTATAEHLEAVLDRAHEVMCSDPARAAEFELHLKGVPLSEEDTYNQRAEELANDRELSLRTVYRLELIFNGHADLIDVNGVNHGRITNILLRWEVDLVYETHAMRLNETKKIPEVFYVDPVHSFWGLVFQFDDYEAGFKLDCGFQPYEPKGPPPVCTNCGCPPGTVPFDNRCVKPELTDGEKNNRPNGPKVQEPPINPTVDPGPTPGAPTEEPPENPENPPFEGGEDPEDGTNTDPEGDPGGGAEPNPSDF